jgi:metallo-beta-lactamase family protein
MHLLEANGHRVLFDCGLYQGRRKEAFERNRNLPFDPRTIHAIVLSHAHVDHSGNLPTLVRKGFGGPIYATPATCDLCDVLLRDCAHIQERDVEFVNKRRRAQGKNPFEPLYRLPDAEAASGRCVPKSYGEWFDVSDGVRACFRDAGHILGSAMVLIEVAESGSKVRLAFTGDLGRKNYPILRDPASVTGLDCLITESTYGNRVHEPTAETEANMEAVLNEAYARGGKIIIPAFSVGRTQNVVYMLRRLLLTGRIRRVPIFVDSPLSVNVTEVFRRHSECYDAETKALLAQSGDPFGFDMLDYITDVEQSKALNTLQKPCIIISASGMCESGRILHHLRNSIGNPANTILIIGYQAEHTLGRRLVEKAKEVNIFGEPHVVRAQVRVMNGLSAHADKNDLLAYAATANGAIRRVFVVHGEPDQSLALASHLAEMGIKGAVVPEQGQAFDC